MSCLSYPATGELPAEQAGEACSCRGSLNLPIISYRSFAFGDASGGRRITNRPGRTRKLQTLKPVTKDNPCRDFTETSSEEKKIFEIRWVRRDKHKWVNIFHGGNMKPSTAFDLHSRGCKIQKKGDHPYSCESLARSARHSHAAKPRYTSSFVASRALFIHTDSSA